MGRGHHCIKTFSTMNMLLERISYKMVIIVSRHLAQGTDRWDECQTQWPSLYQDI